MDHLLQFLAQIGALLALGLGAIGSALGIGEAGQAAAGAWAREGKEGRPLSFAYIILMGVPLSQTIYGFIAYQLMSKHTALANLPSHEYGLLAAIGIACGLAQLYSAWMQGRAAAAGIRSLADNGGKGFANIIISLGVIETVGIFGMVFTIMGIPPLPAA